MSASRDAHVRTTTLALIPVAVVAAYAVGFTMYATMHAVPGRPSGPRASHRGSIWYRIDGWDHGVLFHAFYPLNWLLFQVADIDAQVHEGDSFGYWFCEGDYID